MELGRRDRLICLAVAALLAPGLSLALVLTPGWEAWGDNLRWPLLAGGGVSLAVTFVACRWLSGSRMETVMLSAFAVMCGGGAVALAWAVALGGSVS